MAAATTHTRSAASIFIALAMATACVAEPSGVGPGPDGSVVDGADATAEDRGVASDAVPDEDGSRDVASDTGTIDVADANIVEDADAGVARDARIADATNVADAGVAGAWKQVPLRTRAQALAGIDPGGEGFQKIRAITYAPSNPRVVYLVVDTSQVWKSEDGGDHWKRAHRGFYGNGGVSIVVDPNDENFVLVASSWGGWTALPGSKNGIYRTTNGGNEWEFVWPTEYTMNYTDGRLFVFAGANTIYAATHDQGLLESHDRAQTFTTLVPFSETGRITDIVLDPSDPTTMFVSCARGFRRVTDTGDAYTMATLGSGLPAARVSVVQPTTPRTILAIGADANIYKSTNGGANFSVSFTNRVSGKTARQMSMSAVDPNLIFVGYAPKSYAVNEEFYVTRDGGRTWSIPDSMDERNEAGFVSGSSLNWNFDSGGGFSFSPIATHPRDANIAITQGGPEHIKRTTDGGRNWRYAGNGYTGGAAVLGHSRFAFDANYANRFAIGLTDMGAFLTEDGGSTFRRFVTPRHNDGTACHGIAFDPTRGSRVIVAAIGHNYTAQTLMVSRDAGDSWTIIENTDRLYKFVAFSPTNANVVYADNHRSIDNGRTFTTLTNVVRAVHAGNGDIVYAVGGSQTEAIIYKSTDRGSTWTAPYPVVRAAGWIDQIAVDPDDANRIYLAAGNTGLHIITDTLANGGQVIARNEANGISKNAFGVYSTNSVAIDPRDPNVLYLGSYSSSRGHGEGVFRSRDKGMTWENVAAELKPISVGALGVHPLTGHLYIGSFHGTWRLPPPR